jgi:hypothetical protein
MILLARFLSQLREWTGASGLLAESLALPDHAAEQHDAVWSVLVRASMESFTSFWVLAGLGSAGVHVAFLGQYAN